MSELFWIKLEELVQKNGIVIERPKGTAHPRYSDDIYPVDYGFLKNTRSSDGAEVDIWVGSVIPGTLNAVICTLDQLKGDVELKIVWGCTEEEMISINNFVNNEMQSGVVLLKPKYPEGR
jgi:inorganic pyrophosphatase